MLQTISLVFPADIMAFGTTFMNYEDILGSHGAEFLGLMLNGECHKLIDDEKLFISSENNREYTVQYFNRENFFHEILMRFIAANGDELGKGLDKYAIFLAGYSIELGIAIKDEDTKALRCELGRTGIPPSAQKRMEKALENTEQ